MKFWLPTPKQECLKSLYRPPNQDNDDFRPRTHIGNRNKRNILSARPSRSIKRVKKVRSKIATKRIVNKNTSKCAQINLKVNYMLHIPDSGCVHDLYQNIRRKFIPSSLCFSNRVIRYMEQKVPLSSILIHILVTMGVIKSKLSNSVRI